MADTLAAYRAGNDKWLDDSDAAALDQITEADWPAVLAALAALKDASDPGIDCSLVVTHETLDDFAAARGLWSECGTQRDLECADAPALHFDRAQMRRGQPRREFLVLDLGHCRLVME